MINKHFYNNNHDLARNTVKEFLKLKNYSCIDIGAAAHYWSYPECNFYADAVPTNKEGATFFKIDFQNKETWCELLEYVDQHGRFDYSVCSHTLEDVFNPIDLIELLMMVSNNGFIAIPSKYDEFSHIYGNPYRGYAHHKQFYDVIDNQMMIFPKLSFIEVDPRTDIIQKEFKGKELCIHWENDIPYTVFGGDTPFTSDQELIDTYFRLLGA